MTRSNMANRYSPEVRARAVRMVLDHRGSCGTQGAAIAAIAAIAPKIGCIPQTLGIWVRQAKKDSGMRDGVTSEERDRIKALEREVRELRQANEILRKASAHFAQAELGRPFKPWWASLMIIAMSMGSSRSAGSCGSPPPFRGRRLRSNLPRGDILPSSRMPRRSSQGIRTSAAGCGSAPRNPKGLGPELQGLRRAQSLASVEA